MNKKSKEIGVVNQEFINLSQTLLLKSKEVDNSFINKLVLPKRDRTYKLIPKVVSLMNSDRKLYLLSNMLDCINSVCKWGLTYEQVLSVVNLFGGNRNENVYICNDTIYFPMKHKVYREVLLTDSYAFTILISIGCSKDASISIFKSMKRFDVKDYMKHIIAYNQNETDTYFKNKEFMESISISEKYEPPIKYKGSKYIPKLERNVDGNIKKATEAEIHFKEVLEKNGIKFEFQKLCNMNGTVYIMDFYLTDHQICVEIDGGYHYSESQMLKDRVRDKNMALSGILTIRFTNEEVMSNNAIHDLLPVLGIKYYSE